MVPIGCYLMVHLVHFVYVISGSLKNIQLIFYGILVPCTDSVACQLFSCPTRKRNKAGNYILKIKIKSNQHCQY